MKFGVFLCIALQLYVANSKSSPVLPRPCKRSNPNYKSCFMNLLEKGISILSKGAPEYSIPAMDPFVVPVLVKNITINNLVEGNVMFKNIKISNVLKVKIQDAKIDVDNLSGEIDMYHPEIKVSLQYDADGKLLNIPMHSSGLLKGKLKGINNNIKLKLKPVERRGVKYFTVEYLKLKLHIEDGHVNVVADDPEQQPIFDFAQNLLHSRPYLDVVTPVVVETVESYGRSLIDRILTQVPAQVILPD